MFWETCILVKIVLLFVKSLEIFNFKISWGFQNEVIIKNSLLERGLYSFDQQVKITKESAMEQQFVHGKGRKLERGKGGLRMVAIDEESKSPFEIEEPKWLDDSQVQIM